MKEIIDTRYVKKTYKDYNEDRLSLYSWEAVSMETNFRIWFSKVIQV